MNIEPTLKQEPSGILLSFPPFQVTSLPYNKQQLRNLGCKMCRQGSYCYTFPGCLDCLCIIRLFVCVRQACNTSVKPYWLRLFTTIQYIYRRPVTICSLCLNKDQGSSKKKNVNHRFFLLNSLLPFSFSCLHLCSVPHGHRNASCLASWSWPLWPVLGLFAPILTMMKSYSLVSISVDTVQLQTCSPAYISVCIFFSTNTTHWMTSQICSCSLPDAVLCIINVEFTYSQFCINVNVSLHWVWVGNI